MPSLPSFFCSIVSFVSSHHLFPQPGSPYMDECQRFPLFLRDFTVCTTKQQPRHLAATREEACRVQGCSAARNTAPPPGCWSSTTPPDRPYSHSSWLLPRNRTSVVAFTNGRGAAGGTGRGNSRF
ncbi:hypothetical protein B0H66DRAFT_366737 [Apodospora peruviana]|uniref:Uncharacterized protein n=1 Tax=Apodospora peruviana TaxID=516989 RepID=A0AAE0HW83_9PEZI|nr:hypothetical protein B0H66DRAFT_366737 [Apodospora peruviana]